MGLVVWAMVDYEADDALASAAARAARVAESRGIDKIIICTPDKDLSQCVVGDRVVQLDRRARMERNEAGVIEKFGVPPTSITDYLALVGDASDGFPGVPGWGAKSTAIVLGRYLTLEQIPRSANDWDVAVRGRERLAANLVEHWENALLFRDLATLRTDAPGFEDIEELRWRGPARGFEVLCERLAAGRVLEEARSLASARVAD